MILCSTTTHNYLANISGENNMNRRRHIVSVNPDFGIHLQEASQMCRWGSRRQTALPWGTPGRVGPRAGLSMAPGTDWDRASVIVLRKQKSFYAVFLHFTQEVLSQQTYRWSWVSYQGCRWWNPEEVFRLIKHLPPGLQQSIINEHEHAGTSSNVCMVWWEEMQWSGIQPLRCLSRSLPWCARPQFSTKRLKVRFPFWGWNVFFGLVLCQWVT